MRPGLGGDLRDQLGRACSLTTVCAGLSGRHLAWAMHDAIVPATAGAAKLVPVAGP